MRGKARSEKPRSVMGIALDVMSGSENLQQQRERKRKWENGG